MDRSILGVVVTIVGGLIALDLLDHLTVFGENRINVRVAFAEASRFFGRKARETAASKIASSGYSWKERILIHPFVDAVVQRAFTSPRFRFLFLPFYVLYLIQLWSVLWIPVLLCWLRPSPWLTVPLSLLFVRAIVLNVLALTGLVQVYRWANPQTPLIHAIAITTIHEYWARARLSLYWVAIAGLLVIDFLGMIPALVFPFFNLDTARRRYYYFGCVAFFYCAVGAVIALDPL